MSRKRIGALWLGAVLMTAGWMAHAEEKQGETKDVRKPYGRGELRKMISVVKTRKPPVIDGIMAKGEWDDAAAITGLTRVNFIGQFGINSGEGSSRLVNIANDQSAFWITYDDDNLYVAHLSPPPARIKDMPQMIQVMLKKGQSNHDANIDQDDSIDIDIIDPVYPGGDKYVININSIGTTFDAIWYTTPYAWEKELMDKKLGTMPGITLSWDPRVVSKSTLPSDGWVIEMALPWKDLGPHIKKPRPGEVKFMNFGRLWREALNENHAWAADDALSPAGEVCFMGAEGIVVQVEDTGNLPRGQAGFAAQIKNLYSTERKVIVEVATDSGALKDRKELTLKPGVRVPYRFAGTIADSATTKIALTVTDAAAGKVVHVTTLPVIRPSKPDIFIRRYRSREIMKLETDIAFIGAADLKKTRIALAVADKATQKQVFSKTFQGFTSYQPALELSTKGWVPGDYEARLVISAPGMKPYQTVVDCEYPPLPEWWNNRCGYDDMDRDCVPFPWTDMAITNNTIRVWGRDYRFGKRFLPEQITTLDYPILRAPMRLTLKTADGAVMDTATVDATTEWTKTNRTRIESKRTIAGQTVSLENSLWAEYDGFLWCTVKATARQKVDVVSLELEIPLTKEFTDVINPGDSSLRTTGKLKPAGYTGTFAVPLWLGNGDGGIQVFSGADNKFLVKDPQKVIRVEPGQNGATVRIVMVDTPTGLDAPYEFQFGLIATPVRPKLTRTPFFRTRSLGGPGPWYPEGMGMVVAADLGYDFYNYGGKGGCIYVTSAVNITPEAMAKDAVGGKDYLFADEFRVNPVDRSYFFAIDYQSQAARDYFVWRHWRYQNKYGFTGYFYDTAAGRMLAMREAVKRLYIKECIIV